MIDIETLGTRPGSVILSAGLVYDDVVNGRQRLEVFFNINEQLALGLKIDQSTMQWWMNQSDEAKKIFSRIPGNPSPNRMNLQNILDFFPDKEKTLVFAYGATFDGPLLDVLFQAYGIQVPWSYRNFLCFRTLKEMYPKQEVECKGTKHSALDDAEYQLEYLQKLQKQYNITFRG